MKRLFQFSIGDAWPALRGDKLQDRAAVSILYWRCAAIRPAKPPRYFDLGFNSLLEMPDTIGALLLVDVVSFQFSIGDAADEFGISVDKLKMFQFSIGDAGGSVARPPAGPAGLHVSILYWRCTMTSGGS